MSGWRPYLVLEIVREAKKQICRTVCPSLAISLQPLAHCENIASLHDFSVTIPRCYKDVYVNSSFPCVARLWNSVPIECFPLTYDLNGFKSRINRHLLTVGSF